MPSSPPHLHHWRPGQALQTLLLGSLLLSAAGIARAAPEQIRVSAAQTARAGIATAPALAGGATATAEGANDQRLSGTVVAPAAAVSLVSSVQGGVIQQLHISSLQQVRAGTPLMTLFSQPWMELQRDYLQLAVQSGLADARLARDESLFADGIIAAARLEESRSAARLARLAADERYQALRAGGWNDAAVRALRASHALSPLLTVRARSAGTVLELPVSPGQRVEAGMPLAKVGRAGPLWVELQASRQQVPLIHVGDQLQISGCGSVRVIAISPLVNSANQSAQVRAEQTAVDACLKVNAYVEARLQPARARAQGRGVLVPGAAVVRRGAESFVFVQNAGGFAAVPVRASAAGADQAWVQGALAAGDAVAVRGIVALKGIWAGLGEENAAAPAAAKGAQ